MMTAPAPPDTHTLILLQHSANKPTTRTYLEHASTSAAILDLISLFEHKLRQDQDSGLAPVTATLKYTDMDVIHYIDTLPEIACLIRQHLPGAAMSAYVPKDKEWIKQFVRPVLMQKLESMRAAASAGAETAPMSTLASRMNSQPAPPAQFAPKRQQQQQQRQRSVSPPPRTSSSSTSKSKSNAKNTKSKQPATSKILVASTSNTGKITKRLGPEGAAAKKDPKLSTQLFTAAYAEKKGLAHVAKPLPAGNAGGSAGVGASAKRGSSGGGSGSGGKRGGGGGGGRR